MCFYMTLCKVTLVDCKSFNQNNYSQSDFKKTEFDLQPCKVVLDDCKSLLQNGNSLGESNKTDFKTKELVNNLPHCQVVLNDIRSFKQTLTLLQQSCGDGSSKKIFSCKMARCGLKNDFIARDKLVSSCTKRIYDCIIPNSSVYINCHSANLIYLLTCDSCGLQYVGETVQKLSKRFAGHRSGLKMPDKYGTCKILTAHFNTGVCKGSSYKVQFVEKLIGNGRTKRKAIDPEHTALRKKRELYWMLELRTIFPYRLNDRIGDEYKKVDAHFAVGKRFLTLKRNYPRLSRGKNRTGINKLSCDNFLLQLDRILMSDIKEALNFIRKSLSSLNKKELKKLGEIISDKLNNVDNDFQFSQWYSMALDIIDSKLFKEKPVNSKSKAPPKNICKIRFENKGVEMINVGRILNSKIVTEAIPSAKNNFESPTVVYDLLPPISSKIFNFNKFVCELKVQEFLSDDSILPCNCADSPFRDSHHGHVITGDLNIVPEINLRKLLLKGPKYREPKQVDWDIAKRSIEKGVGECAEKWCEKNNQPKKVLSGWKSEIMNEVDKRIAVLRDKQFDIPREVLGCFQSKQCLRELHSKFVMVPINKATGNVAFVCKRFYAKILVTELGLVGNNSNTYKKYNGNQQHLINQQLSDLKSEFGISSLLENECLPHIYWLPKMHKNPIKFRFIIAAPKCATKPLSKALASIFKQFYRQIELYNAKSHFYSGIKTFWVIQNNAPVIASINNLNKRGKAKSISTFDFSTLYTKIPHNKLITVLEDIVDFCFRGYASKILSVSKYGTRWVTKSSVSSLSFNIDSVKNAIKYLMSNCYFTCGDCVFRQVIGIPMGSDPASFMANLFLYHYENKWLQEIKKTNLTVARKFSHTFRFIDDLNAMNDSGEFERHINYIYPEELELKKECGNKSASFLDLDIQIENGKFCTKLFDKRDAFPFEIVRMPNRSSNIPSKIFDSCIGAETLRIARISSSCESFIESCQALFGRMLKQGASKVGIKSVLKKMYGRHEVLRSFGSNFNIFAEKLV